MKSRIVAPAAASRGITLKKKQWKRPKVTSLVPAASPREPNVLCNAKLPMTSQSLLPSIHVGLQLHQIIVVTSLVDMKLAIADLSTSGTIGFDTESKPTFRKGEESLGPHLVQLSTLKRAYLFSIPSHIVTESEREFCNSLVRIFKSNSIKKVGFGLANDLNLINSKFGCDLVNFVDLGLALREEGGAQLVGTKTAVLRYLDKVLEKPKKLSMSDWSKSIQFYNSRMILYAANDAHVALLVYNEWQRRLTEASSRN